MLVVTSLCCAVRNVRSPSRKLRLLDVLLKVALRSADAVKTQRVLPFFMACLADPAPSVRAEAVALIASLLAEVVTLQPSDTRLMADYVLPALTKLAADGEVAVRCALAAHLGRIAQAAHRFLEIAQWMRAASLNSGDESGGGPRSAEAAAHLRSFDAELATLQKLVSNLVEQLLTDAHAGQSAVKRALVGDVTRLCAFLQRQKVSDQLLPLLITFLNDKDAALRRAFFESIPGVCAFVGREALQAFVLPCILQALTDVEEAVVSSALHALCRLADVGLHSRSSLLDIARKIAPLLCHPNSWLRHGALGFFACLSSHFSAAEAYCLVRPVIEPFLERPFFSLDADALGAALRPPPRREAFDRALDRAAEQQQLRSSYALASLGANGAPPPAAAATPPTTPGAAAGTGRDRAPSLPAAEEEAIERMMQSGSLESGDFLGATADVEADAADAAPPPSPQLAPTAGGGGAAGAAAAMSAAARDAPLDLSEIELSDGEGAVFRRCGSTSARRRSSRWRR